MMSVWYACVHKVCPRCVHVCVCVYVSVTNVWLMCIYVCVYVWVCVCVRFVYVCVSMRVHVFRGSTKKPVHISIIPSCVPCHSQALWVSLYSQTEEIQLQTKFLTLEFDVGIQFCRTFVRKFFVSCWKNAFWHFRLFSPSPFLERRTAQKNGLIFKSSSFHTFHSFQ